MSPRICDFCQKPLQSRKKTTRFCSISCAAKARPPRNGEANANWRGGKTRHPLYETYLDMVARCTRPSHKAYARYGGRGITVCEQWRADFWTFVADVGERPAGLSIDRVNNDGNYEPGNVRWADQSTQSKNRRPAAYAGTRQDPVTGRFLPKGATA